MSKKGCDCKAKSDAKRLIKNIEDINKSSSKSYVKGNNTIRDYVYKSLKIVVYTIGILLIVPLFIPIILYSVLGRKPLKIKLPYIKDKNE